MPDEVLSSSTQPKINPRFLPAIDHVLITGMRLGPKGKHQAINKVLQLVPEWRRGDCWRRIRHLRRSSLVPMLELNSTQNQKVLLKEAPSAARTPARPWSAGEDAKLLDWAGYEPVSKIAQRLNRSVRAVRSRLGALGMSARVSDGWSQRELRALLRVGPAKLRRFVGTGMLRVRDPRITMTSLLRLCTKGQIQIDPVALERISVLVKKNEACAWNRVSELVGISVEQLQALVFDGQLKVRDPFVTDRSFEQFCRTHGDQINLALIDSATAKWLQEEYGVADSNVHTLSRAQKHAVVVRTCKCGRKIAGNIFFKHVKHCTEAKSRVMIKDV